MRHTKSFSLNDSNEIQADILARLNSEPSVSSAVIHALYHWYFETREPASVQADHTAVLTAIDKLRSDIADVKRIVKQAPRVAASEADETQEETPAQAEASLLADGMSEAALVALKTKVFKPGMRL